MLHRRHAARRGCEGNLVIGAIEAKRLPDDPPARPSGTAAGAWPPIVPLASLLAGALTLRVLFIGEHSAYMDEGTYILTGRLLIEQQAMYAQALNWTFGSLLWPLIAGVADIAGGLVLVRLVTAVLGVATVLATAQAAAAVAPRAPGAPSPATVGLLAGLLMAVLPAPIAIGPFGTYDALSFAGFTGGIALLLTARHTGRPSSLLAAATLLFVSFLAKYLAAVYFPFVCLYLLLSPRSWRAFARNLLWFVLPLSAACAAYFLVFRVELVNLVVYAMGLNSAGAAEIASDAPLREYGWQRLDVWAVAGLALLGSRRLGSPGRLIAWGGAAVMFAFHLISRADHDWWKHAIYALFFLAPPAALALAPPVERLLAGAGYRAWPRAGHRVVALALAAGALMALAGGGILAGLRSAGARLGLADHAYGLSVVAVVGAVGALLLAPLVEMLLEERGARGRSAGRRVGLVLLAAALAPLALAQTLAQARQMVTFYPDLTPSLAAIRAHTADARLVLADDSVVRYHLYPRLQPDAVIDPFSIDYRGAHGVEGYRRAIADRYVDAIVLDGGIGPHGRRIREELGGVIAQHYALVYQRRTPSGAMVEIFRPREAGEPDDRALVYRFDAGPQGWGGHPDGGDLRPEVGVAIDREQAWRGRPSLHFEVGEAVSLVGVRHAGPVSRVKAQVYIVPAETGARAAGGDVYIGMVGFDANWQWRDDGFSQAAPPGRWVEVRWELAEPGVYQEIALKFPPAQVKTAYIGQVEIHP